jgi:CheY-specific phosphatase CheX
MAPIDDTTRAKVAAALLSGSGVTVVAREFGVSKSVVSRIKTGMLPEQLQQMATEKKERLEDMIAGYLADNFTALRAQCVAASDPEYIKKQSGESLAILHGVMADKAIRILEAAAAAQPVT